MTDETEHNFEGVWYHWSCGVCQAMNESENDLRDAEAECDSCGASGIVRGAL